MRLLRPISCNIERIPPCWIKNAVSRTRADLLPIGLRHSAGTPLLTTGRPDNLKTSVSGDWNRLHSSTPPLEGATSMRTQRSRVASWALAVCVAGSLPLASIVGRDARAQEKETPTVGTIERLDPRLDQIVPRAARVERIAEGFDWSEGPVWDRRGGFLLFSDVPRNTVFKWQQGKGVNVFLKPSGYTGTTPRGGEPGSNGLLMDSQGRLVLCQHGDRRVARLEAGGTFTTLADRYDGKRFNSPNDGVFKSNGDLYFTDPPYGLIGLNADPAKELDFNGVYRLSAGGGKVTLLTREMTFPNGIAFSPDEKDALRGQLRSQESHLDGLPGAG